MIAGVTQEWALIALLAGAVVLTLVLMLNQLKQTRLQYSIELERFDHLLNDSRRENFDREQRLHELQQLFLQERSMRATFEEKAQHTEMVAHENQHLRDQVSRLQKAVAELQTSLDHERQQGIEKLKVVETAQIRLTDTFKSLSADALSANNQSFLQLAKSALDKYQETAQTDLSHRQNAIVEMLAPVQQALSKVDGKIGELEKERVGAYEGLKQQVLELVRTQDNLRLETANLVKALRAPSVRGQWGEMQLKRVVEMAGMIAHCDFIEQVSANTETGRVRPDMIVKLPGGKQIIVDAKAPLSAYLEALEAPDEAIRQERMGEHARQVRQHIRALSARNYWDQFEQSPEFVVLFLPGETFFSAALEKDPSLIEFGVKERVILATPTTLIALLRAVAFGWRQESIAENARAISDLGNELYKRLNDLGGHFSRVGRHLGHAVDSYNQSVGTLERRVLVTARKFKELDHSVPEMEELNPIEQLPRHLQALEMIPNEESIAKIA